MHQPVPDYILTSIRTFLPETALAVTFCAAILGDVILRRRGPFVGWIVLAGIMVSAVLVSRQSSYGSSSLFSSMYAVDAFSIFFKYVILGSSAFIVIFSFNSDELNTG